MSASLESFEFFKQFYIKKEDFHQFLIALRNFQNFEINS